MSIATCRRYSEEIVGLAMSSSVKARENLHRSVANKKPRVRIQGRACTRPAQVLLQIVTSIEHVPMSIPEKTKCSRAKTAYIQHGDNGSTYLPR